jgi:hypothetical protein
MPAAAQPLNARTIATLAFADELIARPDLLGAYAAMVSGSHDASLVVVSPDPAETVAPALMELLDALAPLTDDAPDIVIVGGAGDGGQSLAPRLSAVLTQRVMSGALKTVDRVGVANAMRLRRHAL